MQIELTEAPTDGDIAALKRRGTVVVFGNASGPVPPVDPLRLSRGGSLYMTRPTLFDYIAAKEALDAAAAAVFEVLASGKVKIETLFVPEAMRGQGVASELLALPEKEAQHRGCHGAWLDTLNPQARRLYERRGYASFGELQDLPKGHTLTFMQKALSPTGQASSCSSITIE